MTLTLIAVGLLLATPTAQSTTALPRVFVFTDFGGQASEAAGRRQSVKDLAGALGAKKKKLVIVERREDADIVIEVLDRALNVPRVVIGMGARPGQPPGGNAPVRTVVLRVQLTRGEDEVVFRNRNTPFETPAGWKSAADDLGKQIEKWIDDRGTVSSHDPHP